MIVIIGIMGWPEFARLIRGNVLAIRQKEYVESARAVGAKDGRIITRYLLPNAVAPIIVAATFRVAGAILQESSLSFLGVGLRTPQASWGNLTQNAMELVTLTTRPWAWVPPGLCIVGTALALLLVGEGLRKALNPRKR